MEDNFFHLDMPQDEAEAVDEGPERASQGVIVEPLQKNTPEPVDKPAEGSPQAGQSVLNLADHVTNNEPVSGDFI